LFLGKLKELKELKELRRMFQEEFFWEVKEVKGVLEGSSVASAERKELKDFKFRKQY